MRLLLNSVLIIVFSLGALSCQEYTEGLKQSSNRADETSAIATLRTIAQAQTTYSITNAGNYGGFEQLSESGLLDPRFSHSNPELHGYVFSVTTNPASGADASFYSCNADPSPTSQLGGRHFYIDSNSQGIRVNATQPATENDEILKP